MREITKIMKGWEFTGPDGTTTTVDLPHTWNARDGQDGGNDYWRGTCIYRTRFAAPQFNTASHQVWIQFDGVNASAHVVLNGSPVCNHDGGYSTFRANITELLRDENELTVEVDNSKNDRVYPQKADFTFYGGIYRDVSLMVVSKNHFTLDYFGGSGIRITPTVQGADASVQVTTWHDGEGEVSIELLDAAGNTVATGKGPDITLTIFNAHLWNGVKDPYLYSCKARLVVNGTVEDETTTRFGVRSFKVDPKKGFFLNGKSYPLHGVSRHQDRKGLGNAITREMHDEDMALIKEIGANTIRLPFHYKLFTDEDYMGLTADQDGFARVDSLVEWCRESDLYLILDMHDAPGGQTGDNIDDSYGYPWLFDSEVSQQLYCDIWRRIADRYKNEPVILGYELFNEPIAPYFENMEELNGKLEDVYKKGVAAIREVDSNHIILLGGAQWNGNFKPFKDSKFDDKIMYTCHRYGGEPTQAAIQTIINFRDSVNLPMYMGEIGHNTDEWQAAFCQTMRENNIGYTFWPYKKMDGSSFVGITPPENWANIVYFSEAPRATYKEIREARPAQAMSRKAMMDFIEACKLKNCVVQEGYIRSLGMK